MQLEHKNPVIHRCVLKHTYLNVKIELQMIVTSIEKQGTFH